MWMSWDNMQNQEEGTLSLSLSFMFLSCSDRLSTEGLETPALRDHQTCLLQSSPNHSVADKEE